MILLNKTDLVSKNELAAVEAKIRVINPYAKLHRTERCGVELDSVLGHDAFNLDRILAMEPDFLTDGHEHEHDEGVTSVSLESRQPLNPEKFFAWMRQVTTRQGPDILRFKGIIAMKDDDQRFVVQGVHMLIEGDRQRPWAEGEARDSRLVLIGRNLDRAALADGFAGCAA